MAVFAFHCRRLLYCSLPCRRSFRIWLIRLVQMMYYLHVYVSSLSTHLNLLPPTFLSSLPPSIYPLTFFNLPSLLLQLKTFTVHDKQTEYYYSMYFNDEKFIVLGNSVRDSTFALVLCEYFACVGALVVIYTVLVLCKYESFAPFRKTLSDISIPCLVFSLAILIKDIYSYSVSFQYVSTEWYRAFPIPIVVPLFAVFNTFISIIVTIIIGPNFQIPLMLSSLASVLCLKGKFYNSIIQVILIFSIALFAVLATFHFTWVILAFSSYPVRCLASQAFTVPLILIVIIVYTIINYVLSSPTIVLEIKKKSKRIAVTLISIFLMVPFLIALMGILYYYSQVLIDVNDSQNYPIKTIIAGLVPTVVTTLGALVLRNTLKAFNTMMNEKTEILNSNSAEENPTHSHNMAQLQVAEGEQETLQRKQKFNADKDSDEEMLPMVEFDH